MNVTACLLHYKRPHVPDIVRHLLEYPFITEIIIWDNLQENEKCWGRFLAAQKARNELIYTQDDDCLVDIKPIYEKFLAHPDRIAYGATPELMAIDETNIRGQSKLALLGWGSFFKKEWLTVFDLYRNRWGEDYTFKRDADRIFTILLKKHHIAVPTEITHLHGAQGDEAMSSNAEHVPSRELAIKRSLQCASDQSPTSTTNLTS